MAIAELYDERLVTARCDRWGALARPIVAVPYSWCCALTRQSELLAHSPETREVD